MPPEVAGASFETDGGRDPLAVSEGGRRREAANLAAALFFTGALSLVPSSLLIEPAPVLESYLLTVLGITSGLACYLAPWERLSDRWLHLLPPLGSVEIALVIVSFGEAGRTYSALYTLILVWIAYVFASRRVIVLQSLVAITIGAGAILVDDSFGQDAVLHLLAGLPVVCISGAFVLLARERSRARETAFRLLAERDPLTGVGNYRALHSRLAYELIRHARHDRPLTVLLIDLDNFKAINDHHGHAEGDRVLREAGRALSEAVRGEDTVARQGGDEFSVLAPEVDADGAAVVAERIESCLGSVRADNEPLRAAIGWATFPSDATAPDDLLLRADEHLRRSKGVGTLPGL